MRTTGGLQDWIGGSLFVLSDPASVSKPTLRVANTQTGHAACHFRGPIYHEDGAAGVPGTLLDTTNENAHNNTVTGNTFNVGSRPSAGSINGSSGNIVSANTVN